MKEEIILFNLGYVIEELRSFFCSLQQVRNKKMFNLEHRLKQKVVLGGEWSKSEGDQVDADSCSVKLLSHGTQP